MALNGVSWIWADEPGMEATRNAPAGKRYFYREIDVSGDASISRAVATFAADNHFKLQVNGQTLGGGDDWQNPAALDIASALKPGHNEIIVQAENDPASGPVSAAGLIGKIQITRGDGAVSEIVTDASWKSSTSQSSSDGKPVRVLGALGMAPWSGINKNSATAQRNLWMCYRKCFSLKKKPTSALAPIAVDSKYWLWINGKLAVYEGGLKRGPDPQDTYFDVVDLAPYLRKGSNTIAVLAWYWGKEGFSHKSSGQAGFVFELDAGGTKNISDETWKVLRHPAYGNTGEPHPNFRLQEENIHFDARLDLGDWTAARFNDSSWPSALAFGRPPCAPWNQLVERPIP